MRADVCPEGLIIFGFGGHARSVADIALAMGILKLRFIDSAARDNEHYLNHPVEADWDGQLPAHWAVFSAAGDNRRRRTHLEQAQRCGWPVATLVAPTASLGTSCRISPGCFVGQHAHIGPHANIGEGCIINSGSIVEHESTVGGYSHVAVNATVAGRSVLGTENFIGAGATVIDGIHLVDRVQLGAGAVATMNLNDPGLYLGVPARLYRRDGD
jgi:sugar O-acyltransferase (sialic acid O-acetyltransferase NeuD family)